MLFLTFVHADHVDLDLCVQAVVASFGPFVKYQTALSSESRRSVVVSHNQ